MSFLQKLFYELNESISKVNIYDVNGKLLYNNINKQEAVDVLWNESHQIRRTIDSYISNSFNPNHKKYKALFFDKYFVRRTDEYSEVRQLSREEINKYKNVKIGIPGEEPEILIYKADGRYIRSSTIKQAIDFLKHKFSSITQTQNEISDNRNSDHKRFKQVIKESYFIRESGKTKTYPIDDDFPVKYEPGINLPPDEVVKYSENSKKESIGERMISDALKSKGIKFETEYKPGIIDTMSVLADISARNKNTGKYQKMPMRFDFYLPEYNLVIEFQGRQHYFPIKRKGYDTVSFLRNHERDKQKMLYVKENGYNLLAVHYSYAKNLKTMSNMLDEYVPMFDKNSRKSITTAPLDIDRREYSDYKFKTKDVPDYDELNPTLKKVIDSDFASLPISRHGNRFAEPEEEV